MKQLEIELLQDYKQFKKEFKQTLKGNLIILSGVNGSGKTQLADILSMNSTDFPSNEIAKNKINSIISINKEKLKYTDVYRRSFKDNIKIQNIELPEPKNKLWHKEQAWICYSNYNNWENNFKDYRKAKGIIQESLLKEGKFTVPRFNHTMTNNTEINVTEEEFKKILPDDFVWEPDDLFSNKINEIFYEFAARRQDEEARLGRENGGFDNDKYIKNAPWTILNEVFDSLKFNYRFKEDYEFETPNFTEPLNLFPINSKGELNTSFPRPLTDLSDGEKSIISLTFALLNEKRRPIEKLLVLDEYDNTLNPSLIQALFNVLEKYFVKKGVVVVMSTHSPVTISLAPEYATFYELFRQDNDSPKILQVQREEYTELEIANKAFYDKISNQKERIIELEEKAKQKEDMIKSSKILFVEDKYMQIYKLAWLKLHGFCPDEKNLEKLFDKNANFKIFNKGNKDNLKGFLCNPSMEEWQNKKIIGLFDFDDAYKCFDKLKCEKNKGWNKEQGEEETCLYKNRTDYENVYAMVLPVPKYRKNIASREYSTNRLEVELLFKDEDIKKMYGSQDYATEKLIGGLEIPKIINKENFWVKALNLPKEEFKAFKPLFEKINELLEIDDEM